MLNLTQNCIKPQKRHLNNTTVLPMKEGVTCQLGQQSYSGRNNHNSFHLNPGQTKIGLNDSAIWN